MPPDKIKKQNICETCGISMEDVERMVWLVSQQRNHCIPKDEIRETLDRLLCPPDTR